MRMLDLFAGIGGFSLAGHWLGWETVGFVEWDAYNQKVLAKNFPGVPIHSDITDYHGLIHSADIITGGFPCQPFSSAGKRQGTNDSRYLWPEMLRIVREVQPAYVVGENVGGIYSMDDGRVFEQVCTDLEDAGYAVQPFRIPACATGAPHRRDRWWFVGSNTESQQDRQESGGGVQQYASRSGRFATDTKKVQHDRTRYSRNGWDGLADVYSTASDTSRKGQERGEHCGALLGRQPHEPTAQSHRTWSTGWPTVATWLCRVDDGLPTWLDRHRTNRLKSLGNSIQPQVAYEILKALSNPSKQTL